ncbi:MAG: spinster family MFS transporter [Pseudomonadales bacterium]
MAELKPPAADSTAPFPKPTIAWSVVALLVLGSLVAFVDRQVVAIVVGPMQQDLGVGDTQIGWLYGVFAVFYALAAVPIAWLADRHHRLRLIAIGMFIWSLMTIACGLTKQFWTVLLARIGVGVGEATITPATTSLLGDYFPREKIPLAMSVYQTGAIIGSGLAFIIGGLVLQAVEGAEPLVVPVFGTLAPWQQTFVYVGLPGFALSALFFLLREPKRRTITTTGASTAGFAELRAFYRSHRTTLMLHHFGFLSLVLMGYAFVFWSITFFVRVHGVPAAEASQTFGWIFLLVGPLGPVATALVARKLSAAGRKDANILCGMLAGLIAIPAIVAVQFAPNATVAFALYAPALFFVNAPFGIASGALPVIAPAPLRAQVAAVYMLIGSVGMMLGPPLAGFFNEVVFPEADGVRYSMVTLTCCFGILGTLLLNFGRKHYARSLAAADQLSEESAHEH